MVITGLGVCAPNGIGLTEFENALAEGKSGIRFHEEFHINTIAFNWLQLQL